MYTLLSTTTKTTTKVIVPAIIMNLEIYCNYCSDHSSKKDIPITTNEAYQIINRQPVLQDNIAYEPIKMNKQDSSRVYETVNINNKIYD